MCMYKEVGLDCLDVKLKCAYKGYSDRKLKLN